MYIYVEMTDMHLMYAVLNECEVRRLYQEHFPQRRIPDCRMFSSIDRLRENGTFKLRTHDRGRPRRVCMPQDQEEYVCLRKKKFLKFLHLHR